MHKRYIIYCDESDDKGRFYSNFYGGILIEASKQEAIEAELQACKDDLNIFEGEMKWERITAPYADKYIAFINVIFDIVARGDMKIRIMFTQNRNLPVLEEYQIGNDYFMLYYQFIKHAFGLQYAVPEGGTASAAVLLDDVPHNAQKLHQFKFPTTPRSCTSSKGTCQAYRISQSGPGLGSASPTKILLT